LVVLTAVQDDRVQCAVELSVAAATPPGYSSATSPATSTDYSNSSR
jgi:hypothetical protein